MLPTTSAAAAAAAAETGASKDKWQKKIRTTVESVATVSMMPSPGGEPGKQGFALYGLRRPARLRGSDLGNGPARDEAGGRHGSWEVDMGLFRVSLGFCVQALCGLFVGVVWGGMANGAGSRCFHAR